MTELNLRSIADGIIRAGRMTEADALAVRRAAYADDAKITQAEAEILFEIERARTTHCRPWTQLFVEALTDFTLNQMPPSAYLSEENAAWIEQQIKRRKEPSSDGDVELVANLIEHAREVPMSFSAFALRLVKEAVLYSDGVDGRGRPMVSGAVSEANIAHLSRILWGAGSEGHLAVSREEAEALFAIADATTGAANDKAFEDLFARAVGNYLLGATGRQVPARDLALRWETEPAYKVNVLGVLAQVLASARQKGFAAHARETLAEVGTLSEDNDVETAVRNQKRDWDIIDAAVMTSEKASWLLDRVNKNGVITPAEIALVRFVKREAASLDASLNGLVAKVA